jgi:hypothetical protein
LSQCCADRTTALIPSLLHRGRRIIEEGAIPFAKLISHELPLEGIGGAIQAIGGSYRLDGAKIRKAIIGAGA